MASEVMMPTLRAGVDTLAHAFGDVLYVGIQGPAAVVSCPACGGFAVVRERGRPAKPALLCAEFGCKACVPVEDWLPRQGWCGFLVQELLALEVPTLHLYGPWNPGGVITREELAGRYETFRQERSNG